MKEYRNKDRYNDELLEKVELLKKLVDLLHNTNSDKKIFFNEYSVVVYCIFIARQLNKYACLVLTLETRKQDSFLQKIMLSLNIDQGIKRMKKKIRYLDDWKE